MIFKYVLTEQQYSLSKEPGIQIKIRRFFDSIGCDRVLKYPLNGTDIWEFAGKYKGSARIIKYVDHCILSIKITRKPWYMLNFFINRKIKKLIKQ